MEKKAFYLGRVESLSKDISALKRRSHTFIAGEVVSFLTAIALVTIYITANGVWLPLLAVVALVAYAIIRRVDIRNDGEIAKTLDTRSVYQHEVTYIDGDFSCFDNGDRYIDHSHPFTFDLDIFGKDSLFNRINRTITTGGSDRLAEYLSLARIKDQGETIDMMAENEPWRTEFMSIGQRSVIDTTKIRNAFKQVMAMNISSRAASTSSVIIAYILIIGLLTSIGLAIAGIINYNIPLWWGVLQFFGVLLITGKQLKTISKAVDKLHEHLKGMISTIQLCRQISPTPPEISSMLDDFDDALASFDELNRVLNALDRRGNMLGTFLTDTLLLSDFFIVRKFLLWQNAYIHRIDRWTDELGEVDALASMATFRYNNDRAKRAKVVDSKDIIYQAKGLYHPFLGVKAVCNDFNITDGNYYIITGANMAGKSTFLRAIGINYVLALNGMPVFADSLTVSSFSLFSSMRTTDDITRGISYFDAELLRLRQLITSCEIHRRTLIILDEILKGTNSLDKLNGSRLFLEHVSRLPVSGVIATHDLELSKMDGARFHNYCFEIELGTDITYSYKITPGVARNQNATFLLKEMLSGERKRG